MEQGEALVYGFPRPGSHPFRVDLIGSFKLGHVAMGGSSKAAALQCGVLNTKKGGKRDELMGNLTMGSRMGGAMTRCHSRGRQPIASALAGAEHGCRGRRVVACD